MIRRFPAPLHYCYLVAGLVTFGVGWVAWGVHAWLWHVYITVPDRVSLTNKIERIATIASDRARYFQPSQLRQLPPPTSSISPLDMPTPDAFSPWR
jgi:hypothetical protein